MAFQTLTGRKGGVKPSNVVYLPGCAPAETTAPNVEQPSNVAPFPMTREQKFRTALNEAERLLNELDAMDPIASRLAARVESLASVDRSNVVSFPISRQRESDLCLERAQAYLDRAASFFPPEFR